MHRGGFILQCGGRIKSAAHDAADPRTRVDGVEHRFVKIMLALQVNGSGSWIVRLIECQPIETAAFAVANASCGHAARRWISQRNDDRLVDERRQRRDFVIEQFSSLIEQITFGRAGLGRERCAP